jgi:hypothetical protein
MSQDFAKRAMSCRGLAVGMVMLLLLLSTAPGLAQTGPDTMNFQGRLLDDAGSPVTEPRCMRFRLCSDADCLESPWPFPDAEFEHHLVAPESGNYKAGLFTVALGSVYGIEPALLYDRDTLFLEMAVAPPADPCSELPPEEWATMEPRSQLRASAYAQRSRRVRTTESDNVPLVEVVNTGSGGAVYGQTASTAGGVAAGEFRAVGVSGQTYGVSARSASGIGVRGIGGGPSGQVPSGKVGVWGDTSDGTGVLGYSSSTTANMAGVAGWATAASGQTYGVWGSTSSDGGYGVYGTGTQIGVRGVGGIQSGPSAGSAVGVWGDSRDGTGVLGFTSSTGGQAGVAGWANATGGQAYGVYGRSLSSGGIGVYGTAPTSGTLGIATSSSGVTYGVYGRNASYGGSGVYGTSTYASGTGVRGQSNSGAGVYGTSASGNGLEGSSGSGSGVYGSSLTNGLMGVATSMSGTSYGVYGRNSTSSGAGVYGESEHANGLGVHGHSDGGGEGVRGTSIDGNGVAGYSTNGNAVFGTSTSGYGVYSQGDAHVEGNLTWQAKTGYLSIAPAAFHPSRDDFSFINDGHTLRNPGLTGGERRHYYALVQLPHGATITKLTIHYYAYRELPAPIDGPCPPPLPTPNDGLCASGRIGLLRTDFTGLSGEQFMAEVREAQTAQDETGSNWTTGISYATVDNTSYAYYIWAGIAADGFWLTGVQIEYQISEPY